MYILFGYMDPQGKLKGLPYNQGVWVTKKEDKQNRSDKAHEAERPQPLTEGIYINRPKPPMLL